MEKAVSEIGLGATEWEEVAADREQWKRLIKGYGEPAVTEKSTRKGRVGIRRSSRLRNKSSNSSSSSNRNRNRNISNSRRTVVDWRKPALYLIGGMSIHNQCIDTQRMYAKYLAWVSAGSPAIFPATTATTTTTTTATTQTQAAATTVRFVSATAATTATSTATATATSAPRTAAEIAACFTVLPRPPLGDISNL